MDNYEHSFYAHAQTRSLLLLLVAEPRTCKQRRPVLGSATLFPHCKQKLVESGLNTLIEIILVGVDGLLSFLSVERRLLLLAPTTALYRRQKAPPPLLALVRSRRPRFISRFAVVRISRVASPPVCRVLPLALTQIYFH